MKRLIFEELLMMSTHEKSARRVIFHPEVTLIQGTNDTGKSSLMKTIYQTFGATPPNVHQRWVGAAVKSAVKFSIDGTRYTILRDGKTYALFDSEGGTLGTYTSVTKELAPVLASLFAFRLRLPLRGVGGTREFGPISITQQRGSYCRLRRNSNQYKRDEPSFKRFWMTCGND